MLSKYYKHGMILKFRQEPFRSILSSTNGIALNYTTDGINLSKHLMDIRSKIRVVTKRGVYKPPLNKLFISYLNRLCEQWLDDIVAVSQLRSHIQSVSQAWKVKKPSVLFADIKFVVDEYIYKVRKHSILVGSAPAKFEDMVSSLIIDKSELVFNKREISELLWYRIVNVSYGITHGSDGISFMSMIKKHYTIDRKEVPVDYKHVADVFVNVVSNVNIYIKSNILSERFIYTCFELILSRDATNFIREILRVDIESFNNGTDDILKAKDELISRLDDAEYKGVDNFIKRAELHARIKTHDTKLNQLVERNIQAHMTSLQQGDMEYLRNKLAPQFTVVPMLPVGIAHLIILHVIDFYTSNKIVCRRLKLLF